MARRRHLNKKFTIAWIVWILAFVVIEAIAVFNAVEGDTLSEQVWVVAAIPLGWIALSAFMLWLTYHFLFDGKNRRPHWFEEEDDEDEV